MTNNAPQREAIIDLDAFRSNLAAVARAGGSDVAALRNPRAGSPVLQVDVSADAYGHGLVPMARAAVEAGAARLEVSDEAEHRRLVAAGITVPVITRLARGSCPCDAPSTDLIRVGAEAYGVRAAEPPANSARAWPSGQPVMSLVTHVVSVKQVAAGHGVSYGLTYRTQRPSSLVIVPVGYADGVPRAATGRASVMLDGTRYPVAGRIAMDQFMLDVGEAAISLGDVVTVFGPGSNGEPTADDWGHWAGASADEIVAGIGSRVTRRYVAEHR